jgi:hypothetical protein
VHRSREEVLTAMLDGVLPSLEDVPSAVQAELIEMTWLDDDALLSIANAVMPVEEQRRLADLSARGVLRGDDAHVLAALQEGYGRLTLRKARALALLSVRSGKRLLAPARAAGGRRGSRAPFSCLTRWTLITLLL